MILYHFTEEQFGIENIRKKRLKIADFSSVNDPFELLGIELSDKTVREMVKTRKSDISKKYGLLCFSEDKYSPVQWAHYADNHKGICLGFEIAQKSLRKVAYVSKRLARETLEHSNFDEKLLTTKFSHWSYEQEYRLILELSKYPADAEGLRFKEFGNDMELKEVYIGYKSDLEIADITSEYKGFGNRVMVKKTRPSYRDFRIVWDKSKKSERM